MKRLFSRTLCLLLLLTVGACSRHKIIPDEELAQIFHDAFLTNAYLANKNIRTDSLKIYEPIFSQYGYTAEDVYYTIGNFSKRKSARLGDVVEKAIVQLESEGSYYNREVSALDTINNVAQRTFTRTLVADSVIRIRSLRDTSRMSFTLDVEPGEYRFSFNYEIDSLDQNERNIRGNLWLERADKSRSNVYTTLLRRDREEQFSRTLTVDSTHRRLRIHFLTYGEKPKQPSMRVTNLKIQYIPPAEQAVDSLYRKQLPVRIFAKEFFGATATPSNDVAANPKDSL